MSNPLKLLFVDDEADIREVVEFALEDESDFQIRLCASAAEALAQIEREPPDLILLDVQMPIMDGPSLLAELRQRGVNQAVAFMTAKVQPQDVQTLLALGAVAVIAKPFDPMALAESIRNLWTESQQSPSAPGDRTTCPD